MKKRRISIALAAAVVFCGLAFAPPARAQRGGHFHGRIVVGGGWWGPWGGGWGWGGPWGWWGPGYWGPYGYGYGYRRGYRTVGSFAAIKTDVEPDEAELYLQGRYIGTADDFDGFPDYLYLKRGHYKLEFRLEGYRSYTAEVDAVPGQMIRISDRLEKEPGARRYGSYGERPVPGGIHRYFARKGDTVEEITPYAERQRTDEASEEATAQPAPRGQAGGEEWRSPGSKGAGPPGEAPKEARVKFAVTPQDAAVYIDDHFAGLARQLTDLKLGLAVDPGKHQIQISRPGYESKSLEVTVGAGQTEEVSIKLEQKGPSL
jgi:PEGA domain